MVAAAAARPLRPTAGPVRGPALLRSPQLDYAAALGGIVLPAMQHTFGRLLGLPRGLEPALAHKQQLMSAASQLHLSVQRHLNPAGPAHQ